MVQVSKESGKASWPFTLIAYGILGILSIYFEEFTYWEILVTKLQKGLLYAEYI